MDKEVLENIEKSEAIIVKKFIKDGRRHRISRSKASPVGRSEVHWIEAEYEEIAPGCWQKVYGTEKDLGPVQEE